MSTTFDETFEKMGAPDYPVRCVDCATDATNATIDDHECPPESEGFYLIHPGNGTFDVRGRDGVSPFGKFSERRTAESAQRMLNLLVTIEKQIEEINRTLRRQPAGLRELDRRRRGGQ